MSPPIRLDAVDAGVPPVHLGEATITRNDRVNSRRKVRAINQFHVTQLAYLLQRLKSIREGDGTLLDHSMIAYGCGNSDGDRHNHDDLPILVAGRGGGTIATGRHLRFKDETPVTNLWASLLERMDVRVPFGDSTGPLSGLA